jgi:bacteriorhodopsin
MENVVQVVEIIFYHWYRSLAVGSAAVASGALDIAWVRYIDWFFTTPVMLISTALFFEWQRRGSGGGDAGGGDGAFSLWNWLGENQTAVGGMVLANGIMLAVGFLQEMGVLDIVTSSIVGFAALGVSFWVLSQLRSQRGGDEDGKSVLLGQRGGMSDWLYPFMYVVWALYGVAAMLPSLWKNVMYNVLDLFSKNFYGMYVSWLILSR